MIKWYGDCLARLGLFSVGGRLLRTCAEDSGDDMQPRKIIIVIENMAGKGGTERVASGFVNTLARLPRLRGRGVFAVWQANFFPLAATSGCAAAVAIRCSGRGGWRSRCGVNART
ncbi:hypothetical protein M8494_07095 [Serratia ureilytica]